MRVSIKELAEMKSASSKIAMVTAYDFTSAKIIDDAGLSIMLVGDSLGNVILGYESTIPVTVDDMIHHAKAVVKGSQTAHVVVDMPFLSYRTGNVDALRNSGRFFQEAGAQSVKLEGGVEVSETVRHIVNAGMPVMGHIGLTPQSLNKFGAYKVQGRSPESAKRLIDDAVALQDAGAYALVLELVPSKLAKIITDKLTIPTIGIGAGPDCDGQVLVFHDLVGLTKGFKHSRRYANLDQDIKSAVTQYIFDVQHGTFPSDSESFEVDDSVIQSVNE